MIIFALAVTLPFLSVVLVQAGQPTIIPELSDAELQDYGQVISIEDGAYPVFVVTIDFFKSAQRVSMNLNVEEIAQNQEELFDLQGQNVLVHYTVDDDNALFDLQVGAGLLFGGDLPPGLKSFTGIFQGPKRETAGDLPDLIYLTDAYGAEKQFEFFVTSEMVLLNGEAVTAFYDTRSRQDIRFIQAY